MKLVCPSCGAIHSAEAWSNDADARKFLVVLMEMPGACGKLALAYLAFFRADSGKGLRWAKAIRLAEELHNMISSKTVHFGHKRAVRNNARYWIEAMERMIEKPPYRLPLKNHNYLKAIVYEIAEEDELQRQRNSSYRYHRRSERREIVRSGGSGVGDSSAPVGMTKNSESDRERRQSADDRDSARNDDVKEEDMPSPEDVSKLVAGVVKRRTVK